MKQVLSFILLLSVIGVDGQSKSPKMPTRIGLPNGWSITPVGKSLPLGDLPLNIAVSPSKKLLAVTNNGQSTQSIQLIDAVAQKVTCTITIPKSWLGLQFSADERSLYASGGNDNRIVKYAIEKGQLLLKDSFLLGKKWPTKISPAGFTVDERRQRMYVVTKENNSLYVIDLKTKQILQRDTLGTEGYTCLLSPIRPELYISIWGGSKVVVFNTLKNRFTDTVMTGEHPNDLCLSRNGKFLFTANAADNSVSVIDLQKRKVVETLNAALYPQSIPGSTTNSVSLSADEKTLYVANADNNCLAVFDVAKPGFSKSKGFIPVGWYPTCVRVIGNTIYVANGKGYTSKPNAGFDPFNTRSKISFQSGDDQDGYIGGLFKGTLSIIPTPTAATLSRYSQWVYANTPYHKDKELQSNGEPGNPIPTKIGGTSPIKYVFYVIKENRTYDQVLSDVSGGNGDTSLLLFGERITPNLHALAKEFVLLDNFYVDAEVSADGHNWSTGAYANDYLEKTWPTSYGGRGGSYDAEGSRAIANNKGGFIWDHCARAGVSFRTYGEFADDYKPNIPVLKNHFCPYYTSWDQSVRDTTRFGQWKRDFDSLLAINKVPQLSTLRLINDHTEGSSLGRPTPFAHCADNDLAVGLFVEYLSKSPIWKETAIFILEDDAQDGPDHVDAHRSTGYVAGGFVKRGFIDHTMYSTTSMLRTMELILGIPPMSQFDAAATPLWRCFQAEPDLRSFEVKPLQWDINEKNTRQNAWQKMSETLDFSKEDKAPDHLFSEIIWKAVKGEHSIMPSPKRAAFVHEVEKEEEDD